MQLDNVLRIGCRDPPVAPRIGRYQMKIFHQGSTARRCHPASRVTTTGSSAQALMQDSDTPYIRNYYQIICLIYQMEPLPTGCRNAG
jgi:hypothetical protein